MELTNSNIYNYVNNIVTNFINIETYIPAKANFLIQRNITLLTEAAKEIEQARLHIIKHYGVLENTETLEYSFSDINLKQAEQEMEDLLNIVQSIDLKTFTIEELGNAEFTPAQMQAIMFMIEE